MKSKILIQFKRKKIGKVLSIEGDIFFSFLALYKIIIDEWRKKLKKKKKERVDRRFRFSDFKRNYSLKLYIKTEFNLFIENITFI